MLVSILTLFPEMFEGPFTHSILRIAQDKNLLKINIVNIRDFATDRHKTVDDAPYGGGVGMIMKVDIIDRALQSVIDQRPKTKDRRLIILLDPQGKTLTQKKAQNLAKFDHLILICGHYEGVDERVRQLVDEEISIGDYILTGGEIPTMVMVDTVARLIPGVLAKKEAAKLESFSPYILEYPQYTRPPIYEPQTKKGKPIRKLSVPQILLSGDHAEIEKWRQKEALKRTKKKRPDLLLKETIQTG